MAQRKNIIAKVTKILARAKSTNFEQEAQTALLSAQKLLAANKSIVEVETMCKGCPWANPETCLTCECRDKQSDSASAVKQEYSSMQMKPPQLCKRPGLKWHSAGISPTPMEFINTPVEKDRIPK